MNMTPFLMAIFPRKLVAGVKKGELGGNSGHDPLDNFQKGGIMGRKKLFALIMRSNQ